MDNRSTNNSIKYIKDFLEGKLDIWIKPDNPLKDLVLPPIPKPVPYFFLKEDEIGKKIDENEKVILIEAGENRGFAAGNNIGVKYALTKDDFEYIWILNNDTVISNDAIASMVDFMEKNRDIGVSGSKLMFYEKPDILQVAGGGKITRFLKKPLHFGRGEDEKKWCAHMELENVIGASMFVRKEVIDKVGMMREDFFMYAEETEWCFRIRDKGYKLFYNPSSKVWHKESVSFGKSNPLMFYYSTRNHLILLKERNISYTPFIFYIFLRNLFYSLKFNRKDIMVYTLKGIRDFFKGKIGKL